MGFYIMIYSPMKTKRRRYVTITRWNVGSNYDINNVIKTIHQIMRYRTTTLVQKRQLFRCHDDKITSLQININPSIWDPSFP
jgi:hypothetical protein